jgi:hypothetical protein
MFDLLAQIAHVHPQVVGIVCMTWPPEFLQQMAMGQYAVGPCREQGKQAVFDRREVHRLPGAADPPMCTVQRDIPKAHQGVVGTDDLLTPPKVGPGSGQEFCRPEGLHQVVVGADPGRDHPLLRA